MNFNIGETILFHGHELMLQQVDIENSAYSDTQVTYTFVEASPYLIRTSLLRQDETNWCIPLESPQDSNQDTDKWLNLIND